MEFIGACKYCGQICSMATQEFKSQEEAEAEAELIKADAIAKANRMISESLTSDILQKMYYDKWDGKLPMVSGDVPVLMDLAE